MDDDSCCLSPFCRQHKVPPTPPGRIHTAFSTTIGHQVEQILSAHLLDHSLPLHHTRNNFYVKSPNQRHHSHFWLAPPHRAVLRSGMLLFAVLRSTMMCCAMLCTMRRCAYSVQCVARCYAVLRRSTLCYAVLRYAAPLYVLLCHAARRCACMLRHAYATTCYASLCFAMLGDTVSVRACGNRYSSFV